MSTTHHVQITFRMLGGMRGGLHDYNDSWYQYVTVLEGQHDVTPFELLHRVNKSWACAPGTCGVYASTGFELLGLALVQAAGLDRWQDYDQLSVIPPNLRDGYVAMHSLPLPCCTVTTTHLAHGQRTNRPSVPPPPSPPLPPCLVAHTKKSCALIPPCYTHQHPPHICLFVVTPTHTNANTLDLDACVRVNIRYPDLTFPGEGPCSKDPLIVHQYGTAASIRKETFPPDAPPINITFYDLYNDSCLNGWTCGNIAAAPSNVARFHYDLHHGGFHSLC
jgi:hypothetical protein